jgi:diadenosine tetraphosphate (Ap4A) HIT family hydrolase
MANATMEKFGYPSSLVREFQHWVVLLRPSQVTLGSLVLAAKSDATAFGALPPGAHAELARVSAHIESMLAGTVRYDQINYLMLMMVDPHVHFHVFPRYEGVRSFESAEIADVAWPGPPDLKSGQEMPAPVFEKFRLQLSEN